MTIKKRTRKLYEVSHDPETNDHLMVPEGFAGFTNEELQAMQDAVDENNKARMDARDKVLSAASEEQERLKELDAVRQPWKTQRDKYHANQADVGGIKPNENPPPKKDEKGGCKSCAAKGLKRLILGGAKLLKAELGIDGVSEEVYEERKKICLGCEEYDFGVCNSCSCFLSAKCRIGNESCPINKWGAEE